MSTADRFLEFCKQALGEDGPLKGQPGALVSALGEAFEKFEIMDKPMPAPVKLEPQREPGPSSKPLPLSTSVQTFEDQVYREPWSVYVIRNGISGVAYIGQATGGFLKRYPGGRWWVDHHSDRLIDDVLNFGLASFRVSIYVGTDEADMKRLEAQLIQSHRLFTYNVRTESSNRPADEMKT